MSKVYANKKYTKQGINYIKHIQEKHEINFITQIPTDLLHQAKPNKSMERTKENTAKDQGNHLIKENLTKCMGSIYSTNIQQNACN